MISQYLDVSEDFNADSNVILDIGEWDNAIVELVNPSGTVNFLTSNDSNAIQGVSDGSAASAINFFAVQGTNLATGSAVTSLAASGSVKFSVMGKYLQLLGTSITADKVLVKLSKIE